MSGSTQTSLIAASVGGVGNIFNRFTGEMGYPTSFEFSVNRRAMKAKQISNSSNRIAFAAEVVVLVWELFISRVYFCF